MTDLHTALKAAVEERRLAATNLQRRAQEHDLARQEPRLLGRVIPGWYEWREVEQFAAAAVRLCERDLRVLERHEPSGGIGLACMACSDGHRERDPVDWPCDEITDLATAYRIEVA